MNALKRLFGMGGSSNNPPEAMQQVSLFSNDREEGKERLQEKLGSKVNKYKNKYQEKRKVFKQEHEKRKEFISKLKENQEKIDSLMEEIEKKKKSNALLEEKIAEGKKKLKEMTVQLEKIGKNTEIENSTAGLGPSLSSLQYENLKEKLLAKNKRVIELEEDLAKEHQKTESLMKEITFLKIELGKN